MYVCCRLYSSFVLARPARFIIFRIRPLSRLGMDGREYFGVGDTGTSCTTRALLTDKGLFSSSDDAPEKEEKDDEYSAIFSLQVRAVVK